MTSAATPPEVPPTTPEVSAIPSNPASNPASELKPEPKPELDRFNDDLGDLPESILESETVETTLAEPIPAETPAPVAAPPDPNTQVRIKTDKGAVWMLLPPDLKKEGSTISYAWSELIQQLQQRLNGEARSWKPNTSVRILTGNRLLDSSQFQDLNTVLAQANLIIKRIYTSRRQTAIAGATLGYSIEQTQTNPKLTTRLDEDGTAIADPLYLQMTLRSGTEIRHDGSVIVMGDMNPGSNVIADGDILVWGKLRGIVHAGANGNAGAIVMATQMQPSQIRIADFVARGPSGVPAQFFPEVAYVTPQGKISIAAATEFVRN